MKKLLWPLMICILMASQSGLALLSNNQFYKAGIAFYQKGQIIQAQKYFIKALQTTSPNEHGEIYKMFGICQFMLGQKANAMVNFRRAVAVNQQITISPLEVLDTSVIPFFQQQKKWVLRIKAQNLYRKRKATGKRTISRKVAPVNPQQQKTRMSTKRQSGIGHTSKKKILTRKDRRSLGIYHFLPFGLPQFEAKQKAAGYTVFLFHLSMAYLNYTSLENIAIQKDLIEQVNASDAYDETTRDTFIRESESYMATEDRFRKLSMQLFVGTWILSSLFGVLDSGGDHIASGPWQPAIEPVNYTDKQPKVFIQPNIDGPSLIGMGVAF